MLNGINDIQEKARKAAAAQQNPQGIVKPEQLTKVDTVAALGQSAAVLVAQKIAAKQQEEKEQKEKEQKELNAAIEASIQTAEEEAKQADTEAALKQQAATENLQNNDDKAIAKVDGTVVVGQQQTTFGWLFQNIVAPIASALITAKTVSGEAANATANAAGNNIVAGVTWFQDVRLGIRNVIDATFTGFSYGFSGFTALFSRANSSANLRTIEQSAPEVIDKEEAYVAGTPAQTEVTVNEVTIEIIDSLLNKNKQTQEELADEIFNKYFSSDKTNKDKFRI